MIPDLHELISKDCSSDNIRDAIKKGADVNKQNSEGLMPLERLLIAFGKAQQFESDARSQDSCQGKLHVLNACSEHIKHDNNYRDCIRVLILQGVVAREAVLRERASEHHSKLEDVIADMNMSIEMKAGQIQRKFKLRDIESARVLLRSDLWLRDFMWRAVIQQKQGLKKNKFFKTLPTEIVYIIMEEVFDHQLTNLQISRIFAHAKPPIQTSKTTTGSESDLQSQSSVRLCY